MLQLFFTCAAIFFFYYANYLSTLFVADTKLNDCFSFLIYFIFYLLLF